MTLKAFNRLLRFTLILGLAAFLGACSGKKEKEEATPADEPVSSSDVNADLADSDSGKALGIETVHFGYNSSTLDGNAKQTLKNNAKILKDHGSVKVQVEGHCDERGGIQYNIALGERRAKIVKAFLVDQGIKGSRVSIISYGKEKPIDPGHDEAAWAKNRRANFRITEK